MWLAVVTAGESIFIAGVAAELTVASVLGAILACCLVTACLFFAALFTASSVNRANLIRNLAYGVVAALILNLIMIIFSLVTWSFQDKWLIIGISCTTIVITGAYIIFALLVIIIPDVVDKDDYIIAALRLYIEIARLFFYLLILLGNKKN